MQYDVLQYDSHIVHKVLENVWCHTHHMNVHFIFLFLIALSRNQGHRLNLLPAHMFKNNPLVQVIMILLAFFYGFTFLAFIFHSTSFDRNRDVVTCPYCL